jgi:hypothetical protein
VSREAWSAMFVTFGRVDWELPMTTSTGPAGTSSEAGAAAPEILPPAPQELAVAPGRAVLLSVAVTHTGLLFVPALVVLAVGAVKLWRERSQRRR